MSGTPEEFNATELFNTYMHVQRLWIEVITNMTEADVLDLTIGPFMSELIKADAWDPLIKTLMELANQFSNTEKAFER